jgi:hypothetical protein
MTTVLIQRTPVCIVGRDAAEIANTAKRAISQWGRGWHEVVMARECECGCKIYARQRGIRIEYALHHSSSYGCRLGRDEATAWVPVEIQPMAVA